jgi:hypothetical protein
MHLQDTITEIIDNRVNSFIIHKGINLDSKEDRKPFVIKKNEKYYRKKTSNQKILRLSIALNQIGQISRKRKKKKIFKQTDGK